MSKSKKAAKVAAKYTVSEETAGFVELYREACNLFNMTKDRLIKKYGEERVAYNAATKEASNGREILIPLLDAISFLAEEVKDSVGCNLGLENGTEI